MKRILRTMGIMMVLVCMACACVAQTDAAHDSARATVLAGYPDALVLFSEPVEPDARRVYFVGATQAGSVLVEYDAIIETNLTDGLYIEDGLLNRDGAEAAIVLYRPEACVTELERERERGMDIYEGEAYIDRTEYGFEIDRATGALLEWEIDD